jgi:DNA-binding beta-propeller fold protein YncE
LEGWKIDRIINFGSQDFCKEGFAHFGFHDREGRLYALNHRKHFVGLVNEDNQLEWTVAPARVFEGVPNILAKLEFPIYIDTMQDGALVVSNFGNNRLYRVDVAKMEATLFVDGSSLGMKRAGNCVVDGQGCVWVNEVEGCRVWRFDSTGKPILTLGDGTPYFQFDSVSFDEVRFNWIYDIRKGPEGNIYVLDSKNFAVRMVDLRSRKVFTLAGTGKGGYQGDGGSARLATFGSSPEARFDGPISISLDEEGNIYVGDKFNHVVRMIHRATGTITTIAGKHKSIYGKKNNPKETNPHEVNLPEISSMDYYDGRLFVPTDITKDTGDLIVLVKQRQP